MSEPRRDELRGHFVQALAARMDNQPEAVRRLLEAKLAGAPSEAAAAPLPPPRKPAAARAPLAQLNDYLRQARAAAAEPLLPGEVHDEHELASVRRFRRTWNGQLALQQLAQATARQPANAGPLNSHMLVLRSLDLMRELSPDYLRRFLVQLEALQWLERAAEKAPREAARGTTSAAPAKRARRKG